MTSHLDARKKLSFKQAEGLEPLPSQLKQGEISQEFRAVLWDAMRQELERHLGRGYYTSLLDPWSTILKEAHVYLDHRLDEFPSEYFDAIAKVKSRIEKGDWSNILNWLEWILKHPACPKQFPKTVNALMAHCHLGYRVVDNIVICPIGSDAERETIDRAFADLTAIEFHGARAHLRQAAKQLTAGHYADSIRESIHAVESVVRTIAPHSDFSKALAKLEQKTGMHGALKSGFGSIYGYTSDQDGIRHPLIDGPKANVDETDALFMIGACAAFVSYLINKARAAGLPETGKAS